MQVFNVEYYRMDFTLVGHTAINKIDFVYEEDYLSPVLNTIDVIRDDNVDILNYIRISGDGEEYSGLIVDIEYNDKMMTISYGTMLQQWFGRGNAIGYNGYDFYTESASVPKMMYDVLINSNKFFTTSPKISALTGFSGSYGEPSATITKNAFCACFETQLNKGMFNVPLIVSEDYIEVLKKCLQHWDCLVWVDLDFINKAVNAYIGTQSGQTQANTTGQVIDITRSNLISASVTFNRTDHETTILSCEYADPGTTEQMQIVYYLHPDNSYDTTASDLVYPVSLRCEAISFDTLQGETAEDTAAEVARGAFGNNNYTNMIEIECLRDDENINPLSMEIGTVVRIFDGTQYVRSILTAKHIGTTCRLTFGVVRKDITKKLKLGGY